MASAGKRSPFLIVGGKNQEKWRRRFPKGDRKALWSRPQARFPIATIKIKLHGSALRRGGGGDRKAPSSPPQRRNPLQRKRPAMRENFLPCWSVAPIRRDNVQVVDRASWGAHLRMREVTGRDASLPAPCWLFPWSRFDVEQLGRCPKPRKGRCPLTLQGGIPP